MSFRYQKFPVRNHDPRRPLIARPIVPVYLYFHDNRTPAPYYALVDSGADSVHFPSELAEIVGIADITTGRRGEIIGIAGQRAVVYYHACELQLEGDSRRFPSEVGFSDQIGTPILGRTFFACFQRVIFRERREELEFQDKAA